MTTTIKVFKIPFTVKIFGTTCRVLDERGSIIWAFYVQKNYGKTELITSIPPSQKIFYFQAEIKKKALELVKKLETK